MLKRMKKNSIAFETKVLFILIAHFLLIFLLSASRQTLGADMLENLMWGKTFSLYYDKHPPFFAWESYITVRLFGGNLFFYHILGPLNQTLMGWFIFLLARKMLGPEKALLAIILFQGIIFHVFYYKFNANTANYGFFGAIYLIFYTILKERKYYLYPLLGILCGIIMLIKYSGLLLIGSLGVVLLVTKEGRECFSSFYFYLSIFVFLLVISSHVYALWNASKVGSFLHPLLYFKYQSFTGERRIYEIPRFILMNVVFALPFIFSCYGIKKRRINTVYNLESAFLAIGVFLPFIYTLIFMIISRAQVGVYWMSMYFSLFPIAFLYFLSIKENSFKIAGYIIYSFILVYYSIALLIAWLTPEDNLKEIAAFVKEVNKDEITDFICNDTRSKCGLALIYGSDYTKVNMELSYFKNPVVASRINKNILIIGTDHTIELPGYSLQSYEKSFTPVWKLINGEKLFPNNKFVKEKLMKPLKITLTRATKNE